MKRGRRHYPAVVLNRINYGEADLIVTFFTREEGKIKGLAKHGRKSQKRFGSLLSTPALADLAFTVTPGRSLVRLEEGDLLRSFEALARNVRLWARAGQALELVDAFCAPHDPAPEVFDLLLWCLGRLEAGTRPEETSFLFQLRLLALTGFGPNLSSCPLCGRGPEEALLLGLHPDRDGLVCQDCAPGGFPVSLGTQKVMARAQSLEVDKLDRLRVSPRALEEGGPFLAAYLRHVLGRELRSARLMDQLGPEKGRA